MSPRTARLASSCFGVLPLLVFGLLPLSALAQGAGLDAVDLSLLGRTFVLALGTTFGALLIGVPTGLALSRTGRAAPMLRLSLLLPAVVPPVMIAQGWTSVLGPSGFGSEWIVIFGASPTTAIETLESIGGAACVLATCFAPIVVLLIEAAVLAVPQGSFDAARSLGASEWKTFRVAAGASVARASLGASCIVFVLAAGECGAPTLLDVDVLGHDVLVQLAAFPDFGAATAAAIPLALLGVCGFAISRSVLRTTTVRDDATPTVRSRTGSRAARSAILVASIAFLVCVAPPFGSWFVTAHAVDYETAFELARAPIAATIEMAFVVAAITTACGAALAIGEDRRDVAARASSRTIGLLAIGMLSIPSVLLGLGASAIPALASRGEITLPGILVARHLAVSWLVLSPRVASFPRERIESAFALGATRWQAAIRIALPALGRPIVAAFLLVFVLAAQDLGATSLLFAPGRETISVALLSIEANSPRGVVAAFALIGAAGLVAAGTCAVVLLGRIVARREPTDDFARKSKTLNPRSGPAGL